VAGVGCGSSGNGIVEEIEICDDGGTEDGDGCSADCTEIEPHYSCPQADAPCELCGDGFVDSHEACDDGNRANGDGCRFDCQGIETNWTCPVAAQPCARCGNGIVETSESCDDGDAEGGDGCSATSAGSKPAGRVPMPAGLLLGADRPAGRVYPGLGRNKGEDGFVPAQSATSLPS
jgi:cysteine-rich repeat protein